MNLTGVFNSRSKEIVAFYRARMWRKKENEISAGSAAASKRDFFITRLFFARRRKKKLEILFRESTVFLMNPFLIESLPVQNDRRKAKEYTNSVSWFNPLVIPRSVREIIRESRGEGRKWDRSAGVHDHVIGRDFLPFFYRLFLIFCLLFFYLFSYSFVEKHSEAFTVQVASTL